MFTAQYKLDVKADMGRTASANSLKNVFLTKTFSDENFELTSEFLSTSTGHIFPGASPKAKSYKKFLLEKKIFWFLHF